MSLHLRRRVRSALATVIDQIVAPFGYQVNVLVECGSPGVISFSIMRLPAGCPRTGRLKPRP
jgi:hypothetical protein